MLLISEPQDKLLFHVYNMHNYSRRFAMNIIEQNKEKINGILETFDRMIINGLLLSHRK